MTGDEGAAPTITIVGGGAWGTTLALVAARAGRSVVLVTRREDDADHLRSRRTHPRSLPGVVLPETIEITTDTAVCRQASIVVVAIPVQRLREAIVPLVSTLPGRIIVSAAKGLETGSALRPSQIVEEVLGQRSDTPVCALSGPNLSSEVAAGKPATTVVACIQLPAAEAVQAALMSPTFRVYTSDDVVGVEMGGALKNIIAIGAGMADGLGAGDNAKAAFLTRGIAEIARLGVASGAELMTFAGLSGIGDLLATCSSNLSRNHRVGAELASGRSLDDILADMTEVAEGVETTKAAMLLGRRLGVELPIIEQMHAVLFECRSAVDAVRTLMEREPKHELSGLEQS